MIQMGAGLPFLFIDMVLLLASLLIWAFWSLEQWREQHKVLRRIDPFQIRKRR